MMDGIGLTIALVGLSISGMILITAIFIHDSLLLIVTALNRIATALEGIAPDNQAGDGGKTKE